MTRCSRFGLLPGCLLAFFLAGCEMLPDDPFGREDTAAAPTSNACQAELPDFDDEACLLHDWIAFGLASQRGDRDWRDITLARLQNETPENRLARAVALAWGDEHQWDRASALYESDRHAAPAALQPLLSYWFNEVEGRRAMAGRLENSRAKVVALEEEKAELAEKLEALTAIERNINLRQQIE